MPLSQGIEIGTFHFPIIRLIVLAGVIRAILRTERIANGLNSMDCLMLAWSFWLIVSSVFHEDPSSTLKFNLGLVFNACGIYFLIRVYCQSLEDAMNLSRITVFILIPLAVEMIQEKMAAHNIFSLLGGVPDIPNIREGKLRAQGPFAHAILAGTVGAVVLPLAVGLWSRDRKTAIAGTITCLTIIVTSASSGPFMSGLFALGSLLVWPYRNHMRLFRWAALLIYIALDVIMKPPAYYLLARIDISGGSTGWHRARLIESTIEHMDEWWFSGTDYTRHWMPSGVSWSPNHTDITNHYIQMGIFGGMALMLMFIATIVIGFSYVGQILRASTSISTEKQFFVWSLGASLFAHAATSISVSYFDQSFVFLYLTLAAISVSHGAVDRTSLELPRNQQGILQGTTGDWKTSRRARRGVQQGGLPK